MYLRVGWMQALAVDPLVPEVLYRMIMYRQMYKVKLFQETTGLLMYRLMLMRKKKPGLLMRRLKLLQ